MQVDDDPNCLQQCLARGLQGANCDLHQLRIWEPPAQAWKRILRSMAPSLAYRSINEQLQPDIAEVRPDVVWFFKGMNIYPDTVRSLRRRGLTLVNYNADHPFRFFSRGSGNRNVADALPDYHLHLTYSRRIAKELRDRCPSVSVAVVPFGHDVDAKTHERISSEEEVLRVCFLGNPDEHRRHNIQLLVQAGLPIDVFGHKWDRFLKPSPSLRLHGQVIGEEMLRTLRRYRVQLNFFRPHNSESHNMRTFEVPACGGIMLAEDSVEHRDFFEDGREAFFFRTPEAMISSARHLLSISAIEANTIRRAARERSTQCGYTYSDRAQQALLLISEAHARRCVSTR